MQFSKTLLLLSSSCLGLTTAFGPSLFGTTVTRSPSRLYISSWGPEGPPHRRAQQEKKIEDPAEKIQSYLPEPDICDVNLYTDKTCLVSGLVKSDDRTDQEMFDMLNPADDFNSFIFDKVICFCNDVKFAKKRLLSRTARYSGLLDYLDFMEADEPNALPTLEQLKDVRNWVACIDENYVDTVKQVVDLVLASPDLRNVAILLTGTNGKLEGQEEELKAALAPLDIETNAELKDRPFTYTLVAVGELKEEPEGKTPYQLLNVTEGHALTEKARMSRVEALRIFTDVYQLQSGDNKAFFAREIYNPNVTEAKLIRGLREAGYLRFQEMDHILRDGVQNYEAAIEDYKTGNPQANRGQYNNWWEAPEFQKTIEKTKKKEKKLEAAVEDEKQKEIEDIAREWAKREFFRQSMAETTTMSEEDFIESVWDRAMFEGDLRWRQAHGETLDEEAELSDFKAIQEQKKQTMLKRAKEELKELLEEDDDIPTPAGGIDDDDSDDE